MLDISMCPVCFNILRPPVSLCESGHGVCKDCILVLNECPICSKAYVQFKHRLLEEILELLPQDCKHGCKEFVKVGEDHEEWCGFQSTGCKLCPWVGFAKDLLHHVRTDHAATPLLTEHNVRCIYPMSETQDVFYPMLVYGHFFWANEKMCQKSRVFKMTFSYVPNGVLKTDLEVKLKMAKNYVNGEKSYAAYCYLTKDALISPGDKAECFDLHTTKFDEYMDKEKKVKYELSVGRITN